MDTKILNNDLNCNDGSSSINASTPYDPLQKIPKVVGRVFQKPSKVIPDQTYTIRELFERAVVGSMPGVERQVYYEDDSFSVDELFNRSGVDLATLDLVELDAMKDQVSQIIESYKKSRST